ncbi:hypothetical protein, variant 1 [Verruconis gallopava]|uniref:Uncharacterized protein n=1 Tax=Verruconis gallopava TaxID=253628 RepID=A0A0D1Z6I9_9PEZI|nr:hypothetical protein, variant 1 [Verruconis gallopava]KIW08552.1 hypothetical protein, variant 1 [Verruconis gallopava]
MNHHRSMSADSFYGYNTALSKQTTGGISTANGNHSQSLPPLEVSDEMPPPPAYSDTLGHVEDNNSGTGTRAKVGDDGRVNIRIDQRSHKLSKMLVPALRQQRRLIAEQTPLPPPYVPPTLGGSPGELPPPPMNVVIHVVGSRGDVQPFVALAKVLRDTYNHRVRLATHPVFKQFVEENGIEFFSIGGDPSELMAFMVKNPGLMPGFETLRNGDVGKRRRGIAEMIKGCWRSCIEAGDGSGVEASDNAIGDWMADEESSTKEIPDKFSRPFVADAIIANPPSFAHLHCAERLGIPLHMMFTMPWSPTEAFPHPLANIESTNAEQTISNYITYGLVDLLTWQGLGDIINRFRVHNLGLEPINIFYAPGMLARLRIPYTYCWSPALIPKPADWGNHINISGFYFLNLASNYTPDPALKSFLDSGPPPVYIGFGSIVVDDPNAMTKMIFEAIKITGQRALVSKGWGGLGADELGLPDGVFMLGNVPHDWLFKHVSCVVHHGGAGTTAAGIACGKPTVIVPFFGDQPFWGSMVARAGAGPKPTRYKDLTAQILADSIMEALKPETVERAGEMAKIISQEKGCDVGAQSFHQMLEMDKMRCSLLPEQAAVWRIRKTQIRLSALAAYTLAEKGVISFSDLKLYRPMEYEVDMGPTDPISGSAGAILDNATTIAMGIADFPVAALKALAIHPDSHKGKEKKKEKGEKESKGKGAETESTSFSAAASSSNSGIVPAPTAQSELTNTSSERASISTWRSSLDLTPSTTPGTTTPGENSKNSLASLELVTSPEQVIDLSSTNKHFSVNATSATQKDLLSPESAHSLASGTATSSSSASGKRPSAMAEALRGLPEGSRPRSRSNSRTRTSSHRRSESRPDSPCPASAVKHWAEQGHGAEGLLDTAYGTGKGLSKIVGAGMKSPMDFTLGLAKGFHNLPKLYGEEVRQVDRVTDLKSGLRVAGKEFGMGLWDGITGLVTQPISGAKKEGGAGFVKGVGRGIAGVVVKPGAGIYSLPGYAMQGIYKEVQKHFGKSVDNYIIAARTAQGWEAWLQIDKDEQTEIVHRYFKLLEEVKRKKIMGEDSVVAVQDFIEQKKEKRREKWARISAKKEQLSEEFKKKGRKWSERVDRWQDHVHRTNSMARSLSNHASASGKSTSELISPEHRAELAGTELGQGLPIHEISAIKRANSTGQLRHTGPVPHDQPLYRESDDEGFKYEHDDDFESALQSAIKESSSGDQQEDQDIDRAIRASISHLTRQMTLRDTGPAADEDEDDEQLRMAIAESLKDASIAPTGEQETGVLRAPSIPPKSPRRSLMPRSPINQTGPGTSSTNRGSSISTPTAAAGIDGADEDDADLKKALEESRKMDEDLRKARQEEEIVLEYVKKQSLLEEEFRRNSNQQGGAGNGESSRRS